MIGKGLLHAVSLGLEFGLDEAQDLPVWARLPRVRRESDELGIERAKPEFRPIAIDRASTKLADGMAEEKCSFLVCHACSPAAFFPGVPRAAEGIGLSSFGMRGEESIVPHELIDVA
jgi:hypothetical protein